MSWPAVPEDLLAGPRGRHACFEVVTPYDANGRLEQSPAWHELMWGSGRPDPAQLAAELTSLVAAADLDAIAATTGETGLLGPVAEAVGWAMYWQPSHDWERPLMTDEIAVALEPVARAVTAAPATRWWSGPFDPARQQYAQFLDEQDEMSFPPPELTGAAGKLSSWRAKTEADEHRAARLPSDPAANYSGYWWSTPALSGLVTTTRSVPGLGALRLGLVEDSMGWPAAMCWPLAPGPGARIFEIGGPEDWTSLVERYPLEVTKARWHDWFKVTGRAGTWLIPDYQAVAADYDGVHLTVGGYLTAAGRALPVSKAAATMLAGWDPDLTYWLGDVLGPAVSASRWVKSESAPLGWAEARE
jgi:hypothetical protein